MKTKWSEFAGLQHVSAPLVARSTILSIALLSAGSIGCGYDLNLSFPDYPRVVLVLSPSPLIVNVNGLKTIDVQVAGGDPVHPAVLQSRAAPDAVHVRAVRKGTNCDVTGIRAGEVTILVSVSTGNTAEVVVTVNGASQ